MHILQNDLKMLVSYYHMNALNNIIANALAYESQQADT